MTEMIEWLEYNGTFSTIRLYCAFISYSLIYVLDKERTLRGILYLSYSVVNAQRHK